MILFKDFYRLVKKIPKGRVATYGQIAVLCGYPRAARMVGWALHQLPANMIRQVPWWRVINREGRVSTTCMDHTAQEQALLLKKEKINVEYRDGNYFVDLKKYLWRPMLSSPTRSGILSGFLRLRRTGMTMYAGIV